MAKGHSARIECGASSVWQQLSGNMVRAMRYVLSPSDTFAERWPAPSAVDPVRFVQAAAESGKRMRAQREALGMSQERLGEAIGVSFQQIRGLAYPRRNQVRGATWFSPSPVWFHPIATPVAVMQPQ
jgi:hypothetical protein